LLAPERVERLRLAAFVHHVGKIGVRDDVLLKPGALTGDERRRMVRHAVELERGQFAERSLSVQHADLRTTSHSL